MDISTEETKRRKRNRNKPPRQPVEETQRQSAGTSEICRKFLLGQCTRGESCKYSHNTSARSESSSSLTDLKGPTPKRVAVAECNLFKAGKCSRGESCKFSHAVLVAATSAISGGGSRDICRNFSRGLCNKGDGCKYSHVLSQSSAPAEDAVQPSPPVKSLARGGGGAPQSHAISVLAPKNTAFMTGMLFESLPISTQSKRAIAEVMKYTTMTEVQSKTCPEILKGIDVLAKAKTGNISLILNKIYFSSLQVSITS